MIDLAFGPSFGTLRGGLRNGYAEFHQFAVHSGGTPVRIGPTHFPYQLANFRSDARTDAFGSSMSTDV